MVSRVVPADDPIEADALEGFVANRDRALRGEAAAPGLGEEPPADLDLVRRAVDSALGDVVQPEEAEPGAGLAVEGGGQPNPCSSQ